MGEEMHTDAHCHAHEMSVSELELYAGQFELIVAVSDDVPSSRRTLDLASQLSFIHPCIGIHPWSIGELEDLERCVRELELMIVKEGVRCLGEIGLDRAFVPETLKAQLKLFREMLSLAREYDLAVNLHAAKAWRLVLDEVVSHGIERAVFHWFTGPKDVMSEIAARGYLISINPTVAISARHMAIARAAPLHALVFESDGPYRYRGLMLNPSLIPKTVDLVAREKGVSTRELVEAARRNLYRLLLKE
ncbi:MAG: TatD family deoxyribonuclease [Thermoprotei archaeon]|nr:MAG: TatD family deoxyribonuclease [Thermoprotei archaeon]